MSEDTTVNEETDKEKNFKALREKTEALEARLAELEPLAVEKAVRGAGFDPDTPAGKALFRIASKDPEADVKALAEELGFEAASRPELTATEQAAVAGAQSLANLNSVTTSDEPVTLVGAIKEAEAAGDWSTVTRLNNQLLAQQMAAKARG